MLHFPLNNVPAADALSQDKHEPISAERAAREAQEYKRDMCAMWVMRAMAHKACKGDPKSPYKFMFDACNDMIGRAGFNQTEFDKYAPEFGIDAISVAKMDNESIIVDSEFYRSHC